MEPINDVKLFDEFVVSFPNKNKIETNKASIKSSKFTRLFISEFKSFITYFFTLIFHPIYEKNTSSIFIERYILLNKTEILIKPNKELYF